MSETCTLGIPASLDFTSIPVIDFALTESPSTKQQFLAELRRALVVVGFFYIKNAPISKNIMETFVQKSKDLCNLPLEKKMEIDMINSKHFLGYSRMGLERTARKMDHREMFDFLTPLPAPPPDSPIYLNVQGPNQWPDENAVPGFRHAIEAYLDAISHVGNVMITLVAEALDLDPTALNRFFNDPPRNKVSLLKYPLPIAPSRSNDVHGINDLSELANEDSFQGVGPHKDGGFLTYLLQASAHAGLEAQNRSGEWIPVPPIPDTFVVNVGRSLEAMTSGVCTATTHRVKLRREYFFDKQGRSLGPRFSFPLFQTLKLDLTREDLCLLLPAHIKALVPSEKAKSDAEAFFAKYHREGPGKGIFTARLTSHPDVGRRWYPTYLAEALKGQKEFKG